MILKICAVVLASDSAVKIYLIQLYLFQAQITNQFVAVLSFVNMVTDERWQIRNAIYSAYAMNDEEIFLFDFFIRSFSLLIRLLLLHKWINHFNLQAKEEEIKQQNWKDWKEYM